MMSRFCWYSVYTYDPRSCHGFVLIEHIYVVHDPIWINVYQLVSVVVPSDQYVCDLVSIIEPFKSVDMSLFCCLMLINIYESHSCYSPWLSWPMLLLLNLFVHHIHRCSNHNSTWLTCLHASVNEFSRPAYTYDQF